MRLEDKGEGVKEGMKISFLIGGLPRPEYNNFGLFTQQSTPTFDEYVIKLLDYAHSEPVIPGSLHPSALRDTAHSAREQGKKGKGKQKGKGKGNRSNDAPTEDCRNFAAGRCKNHNGDKCPYRH